MRVSHGPTIIAIQLAALCITLNPKVIQASKSVKAATSYYLKGRASLDQGKLSRAIKWFRKAYVTLPRHPHFHCHRAQFLNYIGTAQQRQKRPYRAMRTFYMAYRSHCRDAKVKGHAIRQYRTLDRRWMCSVHLRTTPHKARIYLVTQRGETKLGTTPLRVRRLPGKYFFKIRLYNHRTIFWKVELRPGHRLKRTFRMKKGDDPLLRQEKPDVAPPLPLASTKSNNNSKKTQPNDEIKLPNPPKETNGEKRPPKLPGVTIVGHVKPGPPVYKQAWFWATLGGIAVAAIVIPLAIPKEQHVKLGQSPLFR